MAVLRVGRRHHLATWLLRAHPSVALLAWFARGLESHVQGARVHASEVPTAELSSRVFHGRRAPECVRFLDASR